MILDSISQIRSVRTEAPPPVAEGAAPPDDGALALLEAHSIGLCLASDDRAVVTARGPGAAAAGVACGMPLALVLGKRNATVLAPYLERGRQGEALRLVVAVKDDLFHVRLLPAGGATVVLTVTAAGAELEEAHPFRRLVDALPEAIVYLDRERRYRYANPAFLELVGRSEEDVVGHPVQDVIGEELAQARLSAFQEALAGERLNLKAEDRLQGHETLREVRYVPATSGDGGVEGVFVLSRGLETGRRVLGALKEEHARMALINDHLPAQICYFDAEGRYRYCNQSFLADHHLTLDQVVGKLPQEVFGEAWESSYRPLLDAALRGEPIEYERAAGDGDQQRWWRESVVADRAPDGSIKGLYGIAFDITEARAARLAYDGTLREMQLALDSVALPITFVDHEQCVRLVNHTSTLWYGRPAAEILGRGLAELLSEDDYRFAKPYIEAALAGQLVQYERPMRYHDGTRRWVLLRYVPRRDESGAVTGFYTTATDIESRKQQELALEQANRLLTAHLENTPLASFTLDDAGRITRWSTQAEALFGRPREEVFGVEFASLGIIDGDAFDSLFQSEGSADELHGRLYPAQRRDGTRIDCEWHVAFLRDAEGRAWSTLGLVQDVSHRVAAEHRLIEIAQRDTLTQLLNRHALEPTLRAYIERSRQSRAGVAVLFVDLDHFKNINDTLGHRIGDLMLVEIAKILKRCVRPEDEVARIGGDEFMVIIAHDQPKAVAHETAQRIIQALREPIRLESQRLSVAASIGVAVFPDHGRTPEALLRSADLAMYRAKENGKNRFEFFSTTLAQRSERRAGIKSALRLALQRDALRLYFQPRVRVLDLRVVGAEVLLRWTDSRLGPIGPKEFINVAEESGLIHELGLYVFRKACAQIAQWQAEKRFVGTISINFSAHQLLVATFIDEVDRVLEETGCDPRWIEVEITETSMLFDLGVTKNVIADLKHRGMQIAIDDFGTGFSSLSHLQQLDIDTLKIDQSFIRDLLEDAGDLAITRAVISLGRGLGLSVTAEGVENERQLAALREAGCDQFQGFVFSPAVAPEDFEMLLTEQAQRALGPAT